MARYTTERNFRGQAASRSSTILLVFTSLFFLWHAALRAQGRGGRVVQTPKSEAPEDFTGQWVSLVTEDWRFRMITPGPGDYASVPVTPAGRKIADNWDPAKDQAEGLQCKAYGAAAIMRMPGRIRVSWADDETLKIEADAGMQTRIFYFGTPQNKGGDWQGLSEASWMTTFGGGPIPGGGNLGTAQTPRPVGTLKVITTKLKPGYLRKNGIPYSDKAAVTEYYDRTNEPNGDSYLVVTTVVEDPLYLNQPFITSSHFKKETDQSGWHPTPCSAR
jgi:hypothetical protein